jgi:hypothetical protein
MNSSHETQLEQILAGIADPRRGLPDEVFHFIRRLTPLMNVDLLIRRENETLLAWREDEFENGWHIMGGIIRYRESPLTRISEVARIEIGATVTSESSPCNMFSELNHPRGHFFSLLYRCELTSTPEPDRFYPGHGKPRHGQLCWIKGVPPRPVSVSALL